jgi:hypothetical protein
LICVTRYTKETTSNTTLSVIKIIVKLRAKYFVL